MSNSTKAEKGDISQHSAVGRGGRLARRARSFKEDFFGKISQMRTPGGQRSSSPHKKSKGSGKGLSKNPNAVGVSGDFHDGSDKRKGEKDVDCVLYHVNQLGKSLSYLEDTVKKGITDMLPGSVSVILDTVMNIQSSLRKCSPALSDQSSELLSATNQVYQSLAALVRVSDEIFLQRNETSKDNVAQMVKNVREAVQSLVQLCMDKQQNKENTSRVAAQNSVSPAVNGFCSSKGDKIKTEDTSLEVPLTPREKEILEQTSAFSLPAVSSSEHQTQQQRTSILHHSASSDSILSCANGTQRCSKDVTNTGVGPPPKPPFPVVYQGSLDSASSMQNSLGLVEAPPLPPKKRGTSGGTLLAAQCKAEKFVSSTSSTWTAETNGLATTAIATSMNGSVCQQSSGFLLENRLGDMSISPAFDWINSLRHSPESLSLSKSSVCSLDSNLNHSADDLLMMGSSNRGHLYHQSSTTSARVSNSTGASTTTMEAGLQTFSFSTSSKKTTVSYSLSSSTGNSIDDLAQQSPGSFFVGGSSQDLGSSPSVNLSASSPPPALPAKMRAGRGRAMSQYDNVPQFLLPDSEPESGRGSLEDDQCQLRHSQSMYHYPGCLQSSASLSASSQLCPRYPPMHFGSCNALEDGKPPPLPPKKKNIMAYMQTFGSYSQPADGEFFRHSLTTYQMIQAQWQQVELMTTILQQQHQQHHTIASSSATSFATSSLVSSSDDSVFSRSSHESWDHSFGEEDLRGQVSPNKVPPALPPKKSRISGGKFPEGSSLNSTSTLAAGFTQPPPKSPSETKALTLTEGETNFQWSKESDGLSDEQCVLDEVHVEQHLVFKEPDEEGLDVRGGPVDALIAHTTRIPLTKDGKSCERNLDSPCDNSVSPATTNANNTNTQGKSCPGSNFLYLEAFLTTYRTFVSPFELVQKLIYRYNRFIHMQDKRKHIARNAFGVIVQVVDDFCLSDLNGSIVSMVMDFIQILVSGGDLPQAKVLHMRLVDKHRQQRLELQTSPYAFLCLGDVSTQQSLLLDFKSEHLAEQMTLLDAHIFQRIEIPEVLLYAREQKEELSPNLTKFTEHFNNMSYWARSRILEQQEAKERERFVVKFIKIMKCLRKLKNFNSYLAILSALDSAPIRRLEWQRNITEGLKEYCALIDSSSSFRAYRLALAETQPPCIPYIGLILQDLTFVHIGNSDHLPDNKTNFSKRWQQFNILQNMKRFRKCQYTFKKDEQIVAFFNNFSDYLCEESMWQISEAIKPRGGKKKLDI